MNEERAQREIQDFLELFILDGDPPALADAGAATGLDPNEFAQAWDAASKALKCLSVLPPLRAREEIVARPMEIPGRPVVKVPMDAVFLCEEHDCCYVLQSALSSTAGQEWRGISSMPDRMKVGTVWKTLDDKIFATLESRWQIDLPAPPVAEPLLADERQKS